jgi:hypothetical protein
MRHHKTTFDRRGFTLGFSLDWGILIMAVVGLGSGGLLFAVGIAYGLGVLCG